MPPTLFVTYDSFRCAATKCTGACQGLTVDVTNRGTGAEGRLLGKDEGVTGVASRGQFVAQ
jgi:hypothetical protein